MAGKRSQNIVLTKRQKSTLERIASMTTTQFRYRQRIQIILEAVSGKSNLLIAKEKGVTRSLVQRWLTRWEKANNLLVELECEEKGYKYLDGILKIFTDEIRSGSPTKFTAEQICNIIAIACENPDDSGHAVSHWSRVSIAKEAIERGIVTNISITQVGRFLKSSRSKTT